MDQTSQVKKTPGSRWTDEEKELLEKYKKEGMPNKDIAEKLASDLGTRRYTRHSIQKIILRQEKKEGNRLTDPQPSASMVGFGPSQAMSMGFNQHPAGEGSPKFNAKGADHQTTFTTHHQETNALVNPGLFFDQAQEKVVTGARSRQGSALSPHPQPRLPNLQNSFLPESSSTTYASAHTDIKTLQSIHNRAIVPQHHQNHQSFDSVAPKELDIHATMTNEKASPVHLWSEEETKFLQDLYDRCIRQGERVLYGPMADALNQAFRGDQQPVFNTGMVQSKMKNIRKKQRKEEEDMEMLENTPQSRISGAGQATVAPKCLKYNIQSATKYRNIQPAATQSSSQTTYRGNSTQQYNYGIPAHSFHGANFPYPTTGFTHQQGYYGVHNSGYTPYNGFSGQPSSFAGSQIGSGDGQGTSQVDGQNTGFEEDESADPSESFAHQG